MPPLVVGLAAHGSGGHYATRVNSLFFIQLGKENGLTLLLDAEVYDYAFSPQRGEGFKLAIHSHMDQPIMALSDIDLSPGFVTQLSVTPTLRDTTESARWRFTPEERGCYFDDELEFKYLPSSLYR